MLDKLSVLNRRTALVVLVLDLFWIVTMQKNSDCNQSFFIKKKFHLFHFN